MGQEPEPAVGEARKVLFEAVGYLDSSIAFERSASLIEADNAIIQVKTLLPDIFIYSELGDGMRGAILALMNAIENAVPPLTSIQLSVIRSLVDRLYREPFIAYNVAIEMHRRLEEVGLDPDSRKIGALDEHISTPSSEGFS